MNEDRTWLATVLFLDIVRYTVIDVNLQLKVKRHFQSILANEINTLEEEDTIQLDTGDGMAICYLGDPERMYPLARRLREKFSNLKDSTEYQYEVRMGLNIGPVKVVEDLTHKRNCIGSGINDAERVMSFASGNQLLVSRSYFEIVSKISNQYSSELNHLGLRSDKHDHKHDVYELVVDVVRASKLSGEASTEIVEDSGSSKFDQAVIERITNEFVKYIKRSEAEPIMQQSIADSTSVYDLCSLLLE